MKFYYITILKKINSVKKRMSELDTLVVCYSEELMMPLLAGLIVIQNILPSLLVAQVKDPDLGLLVVLLTLTHITSLFLYHLAKLLTSTPESNTSNSFNELPHEITAY